MARLRARSRWPMSERATGRSSSLIEGDSKSAFQINVVHRTSSGRPCRSPRLRFARREVGRRANPVAGTSTTGLSRRRSRRVSTATGASSGPDHAARSRRAPVAVADFRLRAAAARSQSARRPARPAAGVPPVTRRRRQVRRRFPLLGCRFRMCFPIAMHDSVEVRVIDAVGFSFNHLPLLRTLSSGSERRRDDSSAADGDRNPTSCEDELEPLIVANRTGMRTDPGYHR